MQTTSVEVQQTMLGTTSEIVTISLQQKKDHPFVCTFSIEL